MPIGPRLQQALTLARSGDLPAARGACDAVLGEDPDDLTALRLLVKILGLAGDFGGAARIAQGAIDRGADHPGLFYSLGVNRQALGGASAAIDAYTQAIARDPSHVEARTNLAALLTDRGDLAAAAEQLEAALALRPDHVAAWNNLGRVRLAQGDAAGAAACHERALAIQPDHANAHNLLACARRAQGRGDEAAELWRRAIALDLRLAAAHSNLGGWLLDQDRTTEAAIHLDQALAVDPVHSGALINLANLREIEGRLDDAIALDRRAIARDPGSALAHANLGLHLLAAGGYAEGWIEREWRLEKPEFRAAAREFGVPRWAGETDPSVRLLVHAEQGFGDSIHFVRYLPLARARVGRTILECPAPLAALFKQVDGIDEVIEAGAALPDFDAHIPMLSLPLVFGTDLASIPAAVPYIHPDPRRDQAWAARIPDDGALRVGLVWAGNPANANDRRRSVALEALRPLLGLPGARFYSLQKGPAASQAAGLPGLVDLDPFLEDFADAAAALRRLDLAITVDTSVAHLAGALGRPVWTLLCFAPDWRWMRERTDSPWYPTMHLFRAPEPGAWDRVVSELRHALGAALAGGALEFPRTVEVEHVPEIQRIPQVEHAPDLRLPPGAPPNDAPTWHRQGLLELRQKRYPAAIAAFEHVLAVAPDHDRAHNNLGVCHEALGEADKALAHYQRAAELDPRNHKAHRNTGKLLAEEGDIAAAVAAQQRALAIRPDYALAHNDLGICHERLGDTALALDSYQQAAALDPTSAVVQNNLGNLYFQLGQADPALAHLRRAVALDPGLAEAHGNLGAALARMGELDTAHASYARALESAPDSPSALAGFALSCQKLCDWEQFADLLPRLEAQTRAELAQGRRSAVAPFATLSLPWPAELQAAVSRAASRQIETTMRGARDALAFDFDRASRVADPARPLRIGYLSANFRNHALSHLMVPVFGLHDRNRVRVYTYSQGEDDGSTYRQRIAADSDVFRDQRHLSHAEIASQIHADGIDILVDLHGHTDQHRLHACALRPAPIIATYIGFPGCLGAGFVDYAITDAIVTPPGEADLYTEALVLLPECYYVNDDQQAIDPAPVTRAECGLPEEGPIFACFNGSYKIDPVIYGRWMEILRALPASVLWLWVDAPVIRRNLCRAAESAGVDGTRLVFAEQWPKPRHLARLALADLFLDTRIYNAHTTACDALWTGVPVLTCPGATFAGRVGASLLTALDMPELIAPDLDAYVDTAIRLGRDAEARAQIKARLADRRLTQPLFDTRRWVRALERAYGRMWANYVAGGEPPRVTWVDGETSRATGMGE